MSKKPNTKIAPQNAVARVPAPHAKAAPMDDTPLRKRFYEFTQDEKALEYLLSVLRGEEGPGGAKWAWNVILNRLHGMPLQFQVAPDKVPDPMEGRTLIYLGNVADVVPFEDTPEGQAQLAKRAAKEIIVAKEKPK